MATSKKTVKSTAKAKYEDKYIGHKFTCNCCGKSLAVSDNYFKVPENRFCSENIFPVCKKCLKQEYERLRFEIGDKNGFKVILRKMDRPYIEEIINTALEKDKDNPFQYIMKTLNGFKQYINMTYDDSDFFTGKETVIDENELTNKKLDKFTDEDWNRWQGYGLEPPDVAYCQDFYDKIIKKYEFNSINEEMSVQQLAVVQVKLKKAFKDNNAADIDRLRKTISSIENDLSISSRQQKDNIEKDTFGNFIKRIEEEEPIPEAKDEFKDVDGIWKMVRRYILGYLPVMMGKAREQDVLEEDTNILDKYNPNIQNKKEDIDE